MQLPKIDLTALPGIDTITGIFGSIGHAVRMAGSDDTTIVMMVYVYDHMSNK